MNYNAMSVHDLVIATYYADRKDLDNIEPILRKACVREASVGTVAIKLCSSAANFDHLVVTHEEKPNEWNDYDLIPKGVK